MMNDKFITAIIVAAGNGTRMGADVKKQFIMLDDKPILVYSIIEFLKSRYIDEVVLVTAKEDIDYCRELLAKENMSNVTIVAGGKTRQESVFCGLNGANKKTDIVLVHDGARPFVKNLNLKELIIQAIEHDSVTFGVLPKDTIKLKNDNMEIVETLDRNKLILIQTPQAFSYNMLYLAHKKAQRDNYTGTDDTVLMDRYEATTKVVEGSYYNIKITTKEDLDFAGIIKKKLEM